MFSKKLATADYSSGSFFTLCCGFIGKKRRSSDTIGGENVAKHEPVSSDSESETETKPSENGTVKSVKVKSENGEDEQAYAELTDEKREEKEEKDGMKDEQEEEKKPKVDKSVEDGKDSDIPSATEVGDVTSRHSFNAEVTEDETLASPQRDASHSTDRSAGAANLTFENQAFMADAGSLRESDRAPSADHLTSDEHLFDVSDLQHEPVLISKCGSLEVSFHYERNNNRIIVHIHQAREIPAKDRGGANNTQVRVMLLPGKKQKHKTKVKAGDSPVFDEKIYFNKVMPDEVAGMGIRFRLYGLERMRRERMIGESIVGFASLNLEQQSTHWVVLEPRSNLSHGDSGFDVSSLSRSDSGSSNQSLQHGGMPELLMGLAYNGTTGRLSVEIIKGSNFRNMAMNRAPDTYVKLSLMNSSGQEVQHCKTSIRRGQPNPLFKETFMLQVALFQLPDVTLMVSVYNKKSMKKKEMIGWFSLGANSSGEEEGSHWLDMRENKGEQVCRWHVLLES